MAILNGVREMGQQMRWPGRSLMIGICQVKLYCVLAACLSFSAFGCASQEEVGVVDTDISFVAGSYVVTAERELSDVVDVYAIYRRLIAPPLPGTCSGWVDVPEYDGGAGNAGNVIDWAINCPSGIHSGHVVLSEGGYKGAGWIDGVSVSLSWGGK